MRLRTFLFAAVLLAPASAAFAETKNFYDARGNKLGSATTYGDTTVFYDSGGNRTGMATTSGPLDLGGRRR